jgi:hypothetical protein
MEGTMQKSISEPVQHHTVQHHRRDLWLQASSEEVGKGEWWASFAVFNDDREKSLVYWMPSLFHLFASEHEAQEAARRAGLRFIEHLDEQQLDGAPLDSK